MNWGMVKKKIEEEQSKHREEVKKKSDQEEKWTAEDNKRLKVMEVKIVLENEGN